MGVWIETEKTDPILVDSHVTPFVGVWIETVTQRSPRLSIFVTPFVGVWIETRFLFQFLSYLQSHPSWVCGLKPMNTLPCRSRVWSHPSWVCGLKQAPDRNERTPKGSHPSWVCGLKQAPQSDREWRPYVTPFVGVWIETVGWHQSGRRSRRHTLRGCVDWNSLGSDLSDFEIVTPFVGVWIETIER